VPFLAKDKGKYNWPISDVTIDVTPTAPLCNSLTGYEGFLAIAVIMAKYYLVDVNDKVIHTL